MTPDRFLRLRRVLDQRQPDLTVLMDRIHKTHNLSAILRTADAVGVYAAHAVWQGSGFRARHHTAGGSSRWVRLDAHDTLARAVDRLHADGFRVCAAHLSPRARDFRELDFTVPTALLLGNELEGISPEGERLADVHVKVPIAGMVQSLNVSVAAAVILYEAQRQRTEAGLYGQSRLPPEVYRRTLFEWSYPDVAAYCRRRGREYPELDEQGYMIDPVSVTR